MNFKVNGEIVVAKTRQHLIPEGNYQATIEDVELNNKAKSTYGTGSRLAITYTLQDKTGVAYFKKTDFIWYSEAENSRCIHFLKALYDGELPEELDLQEWIGRRGWIQIKHATQEIQKEKDGDISEKTYDNIVAWDFSEPEEDDEFTEDLEIDFDVRI